MTGIFLSMNIFISPLFYNFLCIFGGMMLKKVSPYNNRNFNADVILGYGWYYDK
jgi:hypothetical protein